MTIRRRELLKWAGTATLVSGLPRIGAQAAELGVPTLVLTHLIPPPESDDDVQAFVDDIRTAGFAGELVVAEDLSQVTLG